MICPNCHSDNKEGAKFCNECGFPLTGRIASVAAAADEEPRDRQALEAEVPEVDVPAVRDLPGVTNENAFADETADEDAFGDEEPAASPMSGRSQGSGPLDRASLPVIGVKGVDVDEDGNAFDFSDVEDELEQRPTPAPQPADVTADLSGLDECLVDSGYVPPQTWRSGGTMEMPRVDGAAAPKQKEFRAPDANEKKHGRGRAVVIALGIVVVLAAAAAGITYQMELWGGKMLPDVTGMTQADATFRLEGKGFTVSASQVKSDETEGLVLLMDPSAGARAEKGSEVVIHIAVARTIPDVVTKTKDQAAKLLNDEGFEHVAFVEEMSAAPEGSVLAISPDVGTKAKGSTTITVTVAVPFLVPDVSGQTADAAVAALEAATYVPSVVTYYTEDVPEGTVVSTDPAPGTKLEPGSTVTVNVAKSRASVLVAAAREYLASAGTISIGGTTYEIISVDDVSYPAYNQTAFTITGTAVTTLDGETVRGSAKEKSGTITWDDANNIVSIS